MGNKIKVLCLFVVFLNLQLSAQKSSVSDYNIRWTTPGENSQGSMPIGNGDIGANVWVEKNGDLVFYISKTDAWSEIGRLLKLGKVRISIAPNPFNQKDFAQELKLQEGEIWVKYGNTKIRFWIDANQPVIQADIMGTQSVQVKVTYENWRKERRPILGDEGRSVWGLGPTQLSNDCPKEIFQDPDMIFGSNKNQILALHHNLSSIVDDGLKAQSLTEAKSNVGDPLLHRNYGVIIVGQGLQNISDTVLVSKQAAKNFQIQLFPLTQMGTVENWKQAIAKQAKVVQTIPLQKRLTAHQSWWKNFWNRSYIFISANDKVENEIAETVTQGYILQRFINACGGRGNSPIKFNGSIFTTDTYHRNGEYSGFDADFRLWGGCYWWQNTRLPYWNMLLAGDFDLMQPLYKMYMKALPLRMAAAKKYYNHQGAFFPETMNFWGTYADSDYGCDRTNTPIGFVKNPYVRYYWSGGLELSLMMLDYYSFTQDNIFAKSTLLPFVSEILSFYDQHWKRGADGKILFDPAMSLETFHTAVNPAPEIVGIRAVAEKMLQLPASLVDETKRGQWQKLIADLPPVPMHTVNGQNLLAPAQQYSNKSNSENPELYAIFPYRTYGVGKPDLDLAIRTFNARAHKENGGWQQNSIQAAYLGLAEEAKKMVVESFSTFDKNFRFPAFWGPNYDWTPDQDHGSVASIALQRMLLQYDADKITTLPAWPKEWNVRFKLNIPGKKVFEGVYENGELKKVN